ncbi:hypothetical protein [Salipiger sp. CCB-MM3]|uniref:hypothetical protein n=1 Tax=Salipiger sp. CCB-MM3 TaxID=1792508 RepID=UPI0012F8B548|nr:hypothetical protein [Salipiger sp. CCB-MM3]
MQLALRENSEAAIDELRNRLSEFDVRIVMYIRDPMALLKSWYNEVNKAPQGTRPFPVFFKNLNPDFLAQEAVWKRFSNTFGERAMIVRSYKYVGSDHIRDFLEGIGCEHEPAGDEVREQIAQSMDTLELIRISKRRDSDFDDATLSRTGPMKKLQEKIENINFRFSKLSSLSDLPVESTLSLASVFRHHERLIAPLIKYKCVNDKEANILRDAAISLEKEDPEAALVLMRTALSIRPNGRFIAEKLKKYECGLRN